MGEDWGRSAGPAQEEWLTWPCPPPWWCCVQDHAWYHAFVPGTSAKVVCSLFVFILLFINKRDCAHTQLLSVPYSSFVFYGWRKCLRCLSRYKPCCKVPDPNLSHSPSVRSPPRLLCLAKSYFFQAPNVSSSGSLLVPHSYSLHSRDLLEYLTPRHRART